MDRNKQEPRAVPADRWLNALLVKTVISYASILVGLAAVLWIVLAGGR